MIKIVEINESIAWLIGEYKDISKRVDFDNNEIFTPKFEDTIVYIVDDLIENLEERIYVEIEQIEPIIEEVQNRLYQKPKEKESLERLLYILVWEAKKC